MSALRFRITNILLTLVVLALLALVALLASDVRGGPLDPDGAPGSTPGVRLPGTPISAPTVISQPGHYYLTNDITVTGSQNAITITSGKVSLDLGGFHITGGGGQNSVGIGLTGGGPNVQIRNGSVSNFYVGIDAVASNDAHLTGVVVHTTASRGIVMGTLGLVEDCVVFDGFGEGIVVEGNGSTVRDCDVHGIGLNGVFLVGNSTIVEGSDFHSNGSANALASDVRVLGSGSVVRGNTFDESISHAMYVTGANTLVVDNAGTCNFTVKDSTGTTDYFNNACLAVVP